MKPEKETPKLTEEKSETNHYKTKGDETLGYKTLGYKTLGDTCNKLIYDIFFTARYYIILYNMPYNIYNIITPYYLI